MSEVALQKDEEMTDAPIPPGDKPLIPNKDFRMDEVCPRCGKPRRYEIAQAGPGTGGINTWCGDERTQCVAPREVPDIRPGDYVHIDGSTSAHLVKSVGPHGVTLVDGGTLYADFDIVKLAWRPISPEYKQ